MAMRASSLAQRLTSFAGAGLWAHGLGTTPDEYFLAQFGDSKAYFIAGSQPDSTNVYVTAASAGALASVFAAVNHTWVK